MPTQREMRRALDFVRKVADAPPGRYPSDFIALAWDSPLLRQVMTGERTRLVDHLRRHGPVAGVQALSDALARPREAVSRDLRILALSGLVESRKKGRQRTLRATGRPIVIW